MADGGVNIGKIVRSESHVRYTCQVYGAGEIATPPDPSDYAFGAFVRLPLRVGLGRLTPPDDLLGSSMTADVVQTTSPYSGTSLSTQRSDTLFGEDAPNSADALRVRPGDCAIGLVYDTILVNPAFGVMGPRLSNDEQVALFSPDYVSERAVLVSILLLGVMSGGVDRAGSRLRVSHGVPPLAPDLGAVVTSLSLAELGAFHFFADAGHPTTTAMGKPYLHMGYLPHAIAQENPLLPMAMLRTIERLERLFPEQGALLSIVKRNFAWRLKVQTAG